jgi:gluconokinase
VFAWLAQTLKLDPTPKLNAELAAMEPDAHGLTILPFLAGERSPDWNLDARAAIVGMRLDTTALDIARAALEAVAYRFAIIYDLLERAIAKPRGIIGSGAGLIHSPAWMQIMTDVLDRPMVTSAVPEASSRGAALLALEAMGALPDLAAAPAPLGEEHRPDASRTRVYRAAMARQQALYQRLFGTGTAT